QLVVSESLLHSSDRTVVDQRGLTATTSVDVTVDGVEARVHLATCEPAIVRGIGVVENYSRRREPVNSAGGVGPELLGVGQTLFPNPAILPHSDPPLRTFSYDANVVRTFMKLRWTKVMSARVLFSSRWSK